MSKTIIKVACKLWSNVTANIFFARMPYILDEFDFVESQAPDFYIFSNAKDKHAFKNCVRIYNPGENIPIDMHICDWAIGERYEEEINNPRYIRLPNYVRLGAGYNLVKNDYQLDKLLSEKQKFCAFVYANSGIQFRNDFFKRLSKYKHIDSPGAALNNMPTIDRPGSREQYYVSYDTKVNFLKKYKFTIAFANESSLGYTSEKIYHAMLANSIPIYWGNPQVQRDFNTKSFINVHQYASLQQVVQEIIKLDKNDKLYLEYLKEPWYPQNVPTQYTDPTVILNKFKKIFLGNENENCTCT